MVQMLITVPVDLKELNDAVEKKRSQKFLT